MQKEVWTWSSQRLSEPARLARWGHFGVPVLVFPSAGGDFQEIERFHLIAALGELIDGGLIKVYSMDGSAVRHWLAATDSPDRCAQHQQLYIDLVREEVVPRMRLDCRDADIEPVLAGVSLGAFFAVAGICRDPGLFRAAIGLSGVYDLAARFAGVAARQAGAFSPIADLGTLGSSTLEKLRHRVIILGSGEAGYETPTETIRMAAALESNSVPCRVHLWGPLHDHNWASWREMLPQSVAECL